MIDESDRSLKSGIAFALACVGLMIVGFTLAAISTLYVFRYAPGFPTALISLVVPGAFLIHAFLSRFQPVQKSWNALLIFTAGSYALCLAPILIMHILAVVLSLFAA